MAHGERAGAQKIARRCRTRSQQGQAERPPRRAQWPGAQPQPSAHHQTSESPFAGQISRNICFFLVIVGFGLLLLRLYCPPLTARLCARADVQTKNPASAGQVLQEAAHEALEAHALG